MNQSYYTNTGAMQWRKASPAGMIQENKVHVWLAPLDVSTARIERFLQTLSADEVSRAGHFHFERDRYRFIAARGTLRQILGRYLGEHPRKILLGYTSHGKPVLGGGSGYETLRFNLSHSGAFAVYAVADSREVGIDIERINDDVAVEEIAQKFFSPKERWVLEKTRKDMRNKAFFQYWTRKEAFTKALGEGISFPMEQCDVTLINGENLSPVTFASSKWEGCSWYGQDLFPCPNYAAAIVVEGSDCTVSYGQLSDDFY